MTTTDEPRFDLMSEGEAIGCEFYKTYAARKRRMTERDAHEIVWRIKLLTRAGDEIAGLHQYPAHPSRTHDGIVLERIDGNSKAQPPGTLIWRHREFLKVNHFFSYTKKGFKARDPRRKR